MPSVAVAPSPKTTVRSFAKPQDDISFAKPQDDISSAKTPDDIPTTKPKDDISFASHKDEVVRPTATSAPQPTASPTQAPCTETRGTVVASRLVTGLLPAALDFLVYLPACYSDHPPVGYPVLYLLHGMNDTDEQWVKIGAPAAADELISSGEAPPFLIVMPQEASWQLDPGVSNFGKAVATALVPWIDQHYATCADRLCRAIGGLSRGSGWAIRLGFTHPDLFGAIGAHSLSLFDGDYYALPNWLGSIPEGSTPRLYIDIGNTDGALGYASLFEARLNQLNFTHEWHIFEGGHNQDYWRAHVMDYLKWYTQPWMYIQVGSR
ncbi:MAG: alpha/beta hydrolase-fold protein [Anaerolineaceae bacterium]